MSARRGEKDGGAIRPAGGARRRELMRVGAAALAWAAGPVGAVMGMAASTSVTASTTRLRIGYQKSSVNLMVARERGILEKYLPGVALKWVEFPAGPQLLEALSVDGLDFGFTGDAPPVFAQAAGKDMWYVALEPPKPTSSAILVPPGSALQRLGDLRGRRVAFQKGSSAHYLMVRAVANAGLAWSDIQAVYLPPAEARAAFERGSVDAWAIWDPYYALAEIDGHARVLVTGQGLSDNNSYYLASTALSQDARTVRALIAALSEADAWVQAHRAETAKFLSSASGVPLAATVRFLERRAPGPVRPFVRADVTAQQRVADAFSALGLIPQRIQVAERAKLG